MNSLIGVMYWYLLYHSGKLHYFPKRAELKLTENTGIRIITPEASEMIASVYLPDIHKDPFDRLLIVQANRHSTMLVTKDEFIKAYSVDIFWI